MPKHKTLQAWVELLNMSSQSAKLEQISLDPNNPRFDSPGRVRVPDDRITEATIQQDCQQQLQRIGINDLIESIKTSGFWVVDRVVLRPLGQNQYVVVEGNRRIAALKLLRTIHDKGRVTLPSDIYAGIIKIEALIYRGKNPEIAWIIQGFRHTPGTKAWERYPTARFLAEFEKESKKDVREIAQIFSGMGRAEVFLSLRSFYAFEQARQDEDYGDRLGPEKFGLFDEIVFKRPTIQEWLGWNDAKRRFSSQTNLKKFLSWTTAEEDKEPKLTISKNTRDLLSYLVTRENKKMLEDFEKEIEKDDFDIEQFQERVFKAKERKEPINLADIVQNLMETEKFLNTLPAPKIKLASSGEEGELKDQIIKILESLVKIINLQITNIK